MIGDASFQLRAQIGTGLFSLLRLAAEMEAGEATQAALRTVQGDLRESFVIATLGPAGSGKSTLLNTLFDREFCGAAEPATAGKLAVFEHGAEAQDVAVSATTVQCLRPHIFLRDFTLLDAPGFDLPESKLADALVPFLPRADLFLFVIAAGSKPEPWDFLHRLGREALKRTVFAVWQSDRLAPGEVAGAVKRLRQAMLRHLGQACPIFAASTQDQAGRAKLARWIESEIIFSEPRRVRLREIGRTALEALRAAATGPRATAQARQRENERLEHLRAALAEREEQSQRQVAGTFWTLAQSFDALRQRGEAALQPMLALRDVVRGRRAWPESFVQEIETQARKSLAELIDGALVAIEADLRQSVEEHRRDWREAFKEEVAGEPPRFPRAEIARAIARLDTPLDLPRILTTATTQAAFFLRLPLFAVLGAFAITLGALAVGKFVVGSATLAVAGAAFTLLLVLLLRRNVIASFGHHFTTNRTALLSVIEPPLRTAIEQFYAQLAPPLETRAAEITAQRERQGPLLKRLRQIEESFSRLESDLNQPALPRVESADGS